jgi:hypothetical protein
MFCIGLDNGLSSNNATSGNAGIIMYWQMYVIGTTATKRNYVNWAIPRKERNISNYINDFPK